MEEAEVEAGECEDVDGEGLGRDSALPEAVDGPHDEGCAEGGADDVKRCVEACDVVPAGGGLHGEDDGQGGHGHGESQDDAWEDKTGGSGQGKQGFVGTYHVVIVVSLGDGCC